MAMARPMRLLSWESNWRRIRRKANTRAQRCQQPAVVILSGTTTATFVWMTGSRFSLMPTKLLPHPQLNTRSRWLWRPVFLTWAIVIAAIREQRAQETIVWENFHYTRPQVCTLITAKAELMSATTLRATLLSRPIPTSISMTCSHPTASEVVSTSHPDRFKSISQTVIRALDELGF